MTAVDWPAYAESFAARPPLLEDLLSTVEEDDAGAAPEASPDDLLSRLREAPLGDREDVLSTFVREELKAVLRLPSPPPATARFFDLGMDSLMAVELRNRLNRAFAGEYVASNTVVFDYPDTAGLARFLAGELAEACESGAPATRAEPAAPKPPPLAPRAPERPVSEPPPPPPAPRSSALLDLAPRSPALSAPPPPHPAPSPESAIAIVGMACRLPGAPDLAAFWKALEDGVETVSDGRPDTAARSDSYGDATGGSTTYRRGGFVAGIDEFDARFFGIRPIEARTMDPQQRMLLETSWQALEDAGMDPAGLKGSRTGVYAGLSGCEYRDLMTKSGAEVAFLGTTGSVAAGRVAFVLGLMGPAMPLDMTCASSLAAVHEGAAALLRGEVDLALAGGVNALLSPAVTKFMVEIGLLSAGGRCRTFDAGADGYVRGEGCGMLVLKRLRDAEADGDRVWALVRGSAVNHNGASAGLTVPNGPAQEQVIETALDRAGIPPAEVDYLEAHGTGSTLGDPIEVQAAAAVYGRGRAADRPLLMGTAKTNIGHLEAAAGAAGIIKVVLAMRHGVIPKHLHFEEPNPHVDWDRLPVRVTSEPTAWPAGTDRPRRAGVSAFGISGTNAHVVVEGYGGRNGAGNAAGEGLSPHGPPRRVAIAGTGTAAGPGLTEGKSPSRTTRFLPLSARSDAVLQALAGRYLAWLDERSGALAEDGAADAPLLSDLAWTAGTGRSHFAHRAGVVFRDAASLRAGLWAIAEADGGPGPREAARVAFAYAAGDRRWPGSGASLYRSEPVARAVLDRCDAVLREERNASLLDVMFGRTGSAGDLDDPAWTLPATYALGCALAAQWASVGVRPNVVVGHGVGGLAAAHAAGVFDLEDGLRLAAARGALRRTRPETGEMATAVEDREASLEGIVLRRPSLAIVSGTTGRLVGPSDALDPSYWLRDGGEPEAHDPCAATLASRGVGAVVEIGPHASLGPALASAWPDSARDAPAGGSVGVAPVVLPCLDPPGTGAPATNGDSGFAEAVAGAFEAGLSVSFAGLFAGEDRRRVSLPGYPFERRRHWFTAPKR